MIITLSKTYTKCYVKRKERKITSKENLGRFDGELSVVLNLENVIEFLWVEME